MNLEQGKPVMSARAQKKMAVPTIYYASRLGLCWCIFRSEMILQVHEEFERVMVGVQSYLSIRTRYQDAGFTIFELEEDSTLERKDDEALMQGEQEAEMMIIEAYAALLLAFLSTESAEVREAIASCLPNHNLEVFVPVLERFVELHFGIVAVFLILFGDEYCINPLKKRVLPLKPKAGFGDG